MGEGIRSTAGRRYRRARRLRHERHGVVAVIGTLLALLVFFALFGIFLTQYLPLWMTDNEALFTAAAATSFADLKSSIDQQVALGGPQTLGTPFTISSQSVPLLAQPTQGSVVFVPQNCPNPSGYSSGFYYTGATGATATNLGQPINPADCTFANITEKPGLSGGSEFTQEIRSGILELLLPNRYYTPEDFYLEDDGVVQSQSIGYQIMAFPPPLNITHFGGAGCSTCNTTVSTTLLQLYGNSSTVYGQGAAEVFSGLRYSQAVSSNGGGTAFTFTFEIGTQNPCAWGGYLNNLVRNDSGLPTGTTTFTYTAPPASAATVYEFPTSGSSCFTVNGATDVLQVAISSVDYATVYIAGIQITLGVGGS